MTRMNVETSTVTRPPSGRVAQALEIYRSIAACNECVARGNDAHALTAAWMLPCYQAGFRSLARELTPVEESALRSALRHIRDPEPALP
jgi:hypothetical protein